eukprot:1495015-Rhodomonas_salina.2
MGTFVPALARAVLKYGYVCTGSRACGPEIWVYLYQLVGHADVSGAAAVRRGHGRCARDPLRI